MIITVVTADGIVKAAFQDHNAALDYQKNLKVIYPNEKIVLSPLQLTLSNV